jgi:hypothetical protein
MHVWMQLYLRPWENYSFLCASFHRTRNSNTWRSVIPNLNPVEYRMWKERQKSFGPLSKVRFSLPPFSRNSHSHNNFIYACEQNITKHVWDRAKFHLHFEVHQVFYCMTVVKLTITERHYVDIYRTEICKVRLNSCKTLCKVSLPQTRILPNSHLLGSYS